jgi:hypothetical protein
LNNAGSWESLPNGDRVWRIQIVSPEAKTINLNYSSFHLPVGARFFVYNKTQTLGAFTHLNNKATGEFSTSLLKGESVILEYFEPAAVYGQGTIEVASVVHGYRDLFNQIEGFGSSGACNVNAICDTAFWGNEIRSAVMLLTSGNTRFCSGSLVNNVLQDGTPYVLTAEHCNPASNNIFMFNYQSPDCVTNIDGLTTQSISGCTVRANDTPSDFFLVELSSVIITFITRAGRILMLLQQKEQLFISQPLMSRKYLTTMIYSLNQVITRSVITTGKFWIGIQGLPRVVHRVLPSLIKTIEWLVNCTVVQPHVEMMLSISMGSFLFRGMKMHLVLNSSNFG